MAPGSCSGGKLVHDPVEGPESKKMSCFSEIDNFRQRFSDVLLEAFARHG